MSNNGGGIIAFLFGKIIGQTLILSGTLARKLLKIN